MTARVDLDYRSGYHKFCDGWHADKDSASEWPLVGKKEDGVSTAGGMIYFDFVSNQKGKDDDCGCPQYGFSGKICDSSPVTAMNCAIAKNVCERVYDLLLSPFAGCCR